MATVNVDIKTEVKGLTDIQKLEKRITALERNVESLTGDLGKATAQIDRLKKKAVESSKGVKKLANQVKGFAASLLAAGTAQRAFSVGLDRLQSQARLTALARGYGEIAQASAAAARTAETFNLSQTEANKQFAAIYGRLRPLGLSVNQIEDAYAGLSTAVKTASLDAAGASALFTQVSQALGSGVVQAEELNTVIDQAPAIVVALAKELGVTAGEVKKLASDGQVSSEQLFKALLRVKEEGVEVLAESLDTPAEKIKAFYNTTEDIVAALTTAVIPELVDGVDDIAAALEALIPVAQVVGRVLAAAFKLAAIPAKGFGDLVANIKKGLETGNWDAVLKSDPSGFQQLGDIFDELMQPLPDVGGVKGARNRTGGTEGFPSIPDRSSGTGTGKGRTSKDDLAAIAQLAYGPQIIAAAKANNLDPRLLAGLVQVESGFNASAVSSAGAAGLTQLMPGTAGDLGVTDRFDPVQNLMGGAKYLRQMIDMFGDVTAGLRAYNQGPGNQQRYPGGVVQEAVQYPGKVLSAAQGFGFGGQGIADMNVDAYEEMTKQLEQQLKVYKDLSQEFNRELQLRQLGNDLARDLQDIENGRLDDIAKINELTDESQKAELTSMANEVARLKTIEQINSLTEGTLNQAQAFIDLASEEADLLAKKQAYIEDGINPALAEQYVEIDKQVEKQLEQLTLMEEMLQVALLGVEAESEKAKAIQSQIDKINQLKGAVGASGEARKGNAAAEPGKLQSYMDQLHTELNDTEGMIVSLAQTVEAEIGSAMSNAIIGLIDGTKTAQEAFSDMFKNIGKAFIDMATQMIAKALVMKALGILQGAIGGGPAPSIGGGAFAIGQASFEGGGYTGDGPRSGGLDGRGGYLAMVHPQETIVDHHAAMGRYSGVNGGSGGGSRTIRFESNVINNVEYVTTEQAMAMSRQAADDGAKRGAAGGHARSMSTLKNSRSQRSKIGMR